MKIIIAPDSFKDSISAKAAAEAIARGLKDGFDEEIELDLLPIADGGEGTLNAIVPTKQRVSCKVQGPNWQTTSAEYGFIENTAVIEMASAAGLMLIKEKERSAMRSTTFGVGELIKDALEKGFRNLLLTLGGSATNDGGCGMLSALGAKFFNQAGETFIPTGGTLKDVASIDVSNLDQRLKDCHITVATDVTNPLVGKEGATMVYARQKGANEEELVAMEEGMMHYAEILFQTTGKKIENIQGCGAAGGLSAPLLALFDCQVKSGIKAVLDALNYEARLLGVDAVITGEGKLDRQSLYGKAISGVAQGAQKYNIPVYCFVGCIGDDKEEIKKMGIQDIYVVADRAKDKEDSIKNAEKYLYEIAKEFSKEINKETK